MASGNHTRRLAKKPEKPIFLLSDPLLASEYRDKLFGACIADPYDPLYDFSVLESPPNKLVPGIDPMPSEIDNYYNVLNTSSSSHVKAAFETIVSVFFEHDNTTTEAREAASAKWWRMETPTVNFGKLMGQDSYRKSVKDMLSRSKGGPIYLVTNILVLSAPKIDKATKSSKKDGASAALPNPQTKGATKLAEAGVEVGRSAENSNGGQFRHEMIIALGVYEIHAPKPPPKNWLKRIFSRKESDSTTLPIPVHESNLPEVRISRSMVRSEDGAKFMSHNSDGEEEVEHREGGNPELDFTIYFPHETVENSTVLPRPRV